MITFKCKACKRESEQEDKVITVLCPCGEYMESKKMINEVEIKVSSIKRTFRIPKYTTTTDEKVKLIIFVDSDVTIIYPSGVKSMESKDAKL